MSKVSVILVLYNGKKYIKPVFDAVFAQTHKDLEVIAVIGNYDGSKEEIEANYLPAMPRDKALDRAWQAGPQVKILDPGKNLGFAAANNLGIKNSTGEFIQLVNQDLILEPNYIEEMLKAFEDPRPSLMGEARPSETGAAKVAAATGKLLRYDFDQQKKLNIIDTTGITISSSGRAKDLGQLEIDRGQYDKQREVFGVSGAGPMYRKSALERVKWVESGEGGGDKSEYFDEDFFMYWEDVDLSWRFNNAGFKNVYVPTAVSYHGRTAGQSEGGYLHLLKFIKHHKQLNPQVLKWNYKNHILMYLKNAKHIWHPAFVLREIVMLGYIIVFETSTLKVIPELFRQLPRIWAKRKAAAE